MGTDRHTSLTLSPSAPATALAALVAVALLALLGPASAGAADVALGGACFASGQVITMSGTSFTPGAPVSITGDAAGAAVADAAGTWSTQITAPTVRELGPRTVTLRAVDGLNPANAATVRMKVVKEAFGSNLPLAGRPTETTTWRFAGFVPDRPIYAHFVLGGRSRGDYRFGVAKGDCGTLTAHAPRIAGVRDVRPGRWTVKLDQRKTYSDVADGSTWRFSIVRRAGDRRGPDGGGSGGGSGGGGGSGR